MKGTNFHLVHALQGLWHIRRESAFAYLPIAIALMKGESPTAFWGDDEDTEASNTKNVERWKAQFSAASEVYVENYYYEILPIKVNGNVVVIPIMDAITQKDNCYSAGTQTIQSWYEKAKNDPEIVGVIELSNSPGGSVFGTDELANYKLSYPKPIVSLTEGLCCSAMMYIAGASAYRMATSKNCIVGSIGVMTTYINFKKYYEAEGIDIVDLYSKSSPLKNDAHRRAQQGDFTGYTDEILFKMDQSFMGFMKKQIPNISRAALDGADFTSEDAIKNGLLDQIGTFQQAYDKVISLSQEAKNSNNLTPNVMAKKVVTMSAFMAGLASMFGAEIVDDTQSPDDGKPKEKKDDEGDPEPLKEDPKEEPKEDPKEEPQGTSDKALLASLQARLDALEKKPAGNSTKVPTEGSAEEALKGASGKKEKAWHDQNYEHVQRAKQAGLL